MNNTLSTIQSKGGALRMKNPILYRPMAITFSYDMEVESPLRDNRKNLLNSMLLDVDNYQSEVSKIAEFYLGAFDYHHPYKLRYYKL